MKMGDGGMEMGMKIWGWWEWRSGMVIREWGWRKGGDKKMGMGNMGGKFWEWGDRNGGMGMSVWEWK